MLRAFGYAGFFLLSVIFGLYETFPWNSVKDRLFDQARKEAGIELTAADFGPSWLTGFEVKKLRIKPSPLSETWIELDEAGGRVALLPLLRKKVAGSIWAEAGKGSIEGSFISDEAVLEVDAEIAEVDFGQVQGLRDWSGLPLEGKISLDLSLSLDKKEQKNTKGKLLFSTKGLKTLPGGKAGPLPVPEFEIGAIKLEAPIKEGKLMFEKSKLDGTDLGIRIDGSVQLGWPLARSMANLDVGLKPSEKIFAADPLLKPLLNNFNRTKDDEGFYHVILSGPVKSLRPRAGAGKG
ncbi:MAG: type II secretion system protein GspN [Deltaproteobacteria bacterium]|nr:type II secretion system protein GspN [Deltaproteobacteria bacterium]